jgi:hypothetical protein
MPQLIYSTADKSKPMSGPLLPTASMLTDRERSAPCPDLALLPAILLSNGVSRCLK